MAKGKPPHDKHMSLNNHSLSCGGLFIKYHILPPIWRLYELREVNRMKIRVAYMENERDKEKQLEEATKRLFPDTKVKETGLKDGFLHTVLTVPKPKNTTK